MFVESLLPVARGRLTTVQADALLTDAAKLLCGTHNALVVVCNADGAMVGVVTKTDVVRRISRCPDNVCDTTAAAVMTQEVVSCRPSDPLRGVLSLMKERGFVHIPIIDDDSRPCGVVNARDALRTLLGEVEDEQSLLRDYVMGVGYH
jgi:CBS domain-containing protein